MTECQRFNSLYGVNPCVCVYVWECLCGENLLPSKCLPSHLCWALHFMKTYLMENVLSLMFGADEKTLCKWIWIVIYAISNLENNLVSLDCFSFFILGVSSNFLYFLFYRLDGKIGSQASMAAPVW